MSAAFSELKRALDVLVSRLAERARIDDEPGRELARVLAALSRLAFAEGRLEAGVHPVALLAEALQPNGIEDVIQAFSPLFRDLPWRYGYSSRIDLPGLENRMAWAELVGPLAPFRSEEICLGLTYIAPHTRYVEHRHPAVESYFVLSGSARWTAAGLGAERSPGSLILHGADVSHQMETGNEALLAAYTWSGDILSPSVWSEA